MKKQILLLALLIILPFVMKAQRVEITPYGGYVFGSNYHGDYGKAHIRDNAQYGVMFSLKVSRSIDVDLLYNRSVTTAEVTYNTLINNLYEENIPLSINYMHIGFTENIRINKIVSPFLGTNIGACAFVPKDNYQDAWFFSVGFNIGTKIYFTKRVGFKVQCQGLIPLQSSGYTFFMSSSGSSSGISFRAPIFQFGFTGGLILRI